MTAARLGTEGAGTESAGTEGAGPATDRGVGGAPRLAFDPGRLDIPGLVEAYDTPLYLYDLDVVTRRVAGLRAALPPGVSLAYAVKANPSLAVLAHLASLGLAADVASAAELRTALRAGFEAGRLVMTGPGKRPEEHAAAIGAGAVVTVESPGELERLERASAAAGRVTPILLRASTSEEAADEGVRIIGDSGAGKFGMDDADLRVAARLAAASPHLELLGLHRFGASNVTDWRRLIQAAEIAVQLAAEILGSVGRPVRIVDVGGGLGIPYADGEPALDVVALGRGLASLLESAAGSRATRDLRLVLEPGRFLVGPAGVYVARVVDRKSVRGSRVAILDGGINHVLRPALVGQPHRVRAIEPRVSAGPAAPLTLAGPLCTGLDLLATDVRLELEVGDLVAILDVGAYGFSESMPFFLSHAIPAEVVVRGARAHLARPRMQPEEWIDRQSSAL